MSGDPRCQETSEREGPEVSLGSGQQHWLPRGLLSAESESNGDSARSDPESGSETGPETGDSDKERRGHRKLGVTLSVPTYTSYASSEHSSSSVGSDYYSQASPGSRSSVASETGSEDTCGGHVAER